MGKQVFLSYGRGDSLAVDTIREKLQLRGVTAFVDRHDLEPGLPWPLRLEEGIKNADAVAVVVGSASPGDWQRREIGFALDLQVRAQTENRSWPVIPVLLPGASPYPGFLFQNQAIRVDPEASVAPLVDALAGVSGPESPDCRDSATPYLGLHAFTEDHAGLFFGRENDVRHILERVRERRFVAVVGASGTGKSSVVQAGLIHRLRRERPPRQAWDVAIHKPDVEPVVSLAESLVPFLEPTLTYAERGEEARRLAGLFRHQGELSKAIDRILSLSGGTDRLLIVVDQFEELFTQSRAEDIPPYLEMLVGCVTPDTGTPSVHVLYTIRSDYQEQAISSSRDLADLLNEGGFVHLGPLRREELRDVIERPAAAVGLEFESGLVKRILDDLTDEPGNLPLLEYTLSSLWEQRSDCLLTHTAYEAVGRIEGAISTKAEEVFRGLSRKEQADARALFSRLVRAAKPSDAGADARRRAEKEELNATQWQVAEKFAGEQYRLLVVGQSDEGDKDTVEPAHEAIIKHWGRLRGWIDEDRQFLVWLEQLRGLMDVYESTGQPVDALLRGRLLREARRWKKERKLDLSDKEIEFIRKSSASQIGRRLVSRFAVTIGVLVLAILAAYGLYSRTDHFQIELIKTRTPDDIRSARGQASTEHYIASLGLLGAPHELEAMDDSEPQLDWKGGLREFGRRWVYRMDEDHNIGNIVTPGFLVGLLVSGRDSLAVEVSYETFNRDSTCHMTVIGQAYGRVGRNQAAQRILRRAVPDSAPIEPWNCVLHLAADIGSRDVARHALDAVQSCLRDPQAYQCLSSPVSDSVFTDFLSNGWTDLVDTLLGMNEHAPLFHHPRNPVLILAANDIVRGDTTAALERIEAHLTSPLLDQHPASEAYDIASWLRRKGYPGFADRYLPGGTRRDPTGATHEQLIFSIVADTLESGDRQTAAQLLRGWRPIRLSRLTTVLYQRGLLDSLAAAAHLATYEVSILAAVVAEWGLRGDTVRARQTAGRSEGEIQQPLILAEAAAHLLRDGQIGMALEMFSDDWDHDNTPFYELLRPTGDESARLFSSVLDSLSNQGHRNRSAQLISLMRRETKARNRDEELYRGWYWLSYAFAHAGEFRAARRCAEEVQPTRARIAAYALILREYAIHRDPDIKARLDSGYDSMMPWAAAETDWWRE